MHHQILDEAEVVSAHQCFLGSSGRPSLPCSQVGASGLCMDVTCIFNCSWISEPVSHHFPLFSHSMLETMCFLWERWKMWESCLIPSDVHEGEKALLGTTEILVVTCG